MAAVKIGNAAIRASLRSQLAILKEDPIEILGPYPTLIGEIGVPMEMDGKRAYGWTDGGKYKGDYGQQVKALDASLNGADGTNALSYTTWTYCPDNNHQWGDGWNLEDLSLWSADDVRGARAPRMSPSRNYLPTPSSSKAQLLTTSRSRTSSTSSGPDTTIRQPQPTYVSGTPPRLATPAALTSAPNESAESVGSALTLANEYRLRSRTGNGVRFGDTPVPNKMNGDPSALSFPAYSSRSTPPPVYTPPANPFAFLTDGARAVSAFARPYPQATVGRPKTIDFDIGRAEFTYTVIVNGCDVPDRKLGEAYVPQTTEIFLPLVHFASKLWWEDLESVPELGGRTSDSSAGGKVVDGEDYPPRSRSDTLASESENLPAANSFLSSSLTLGAASSSAYQPRPHPLSRSLSHFEPTIPPEAYSIVVDASCGSWHLDSQKQILHWSYPVPESPDRDVEYTIKIKRMGGAIPRVVKGTIGQDYSSPEKKKSADEGGSSIWDACCGSEGGVGCTIM
ncbi:hypothetical protein FRC00_011697 [Tulasnella sp. 408]|nr:hypothetical protein FRC00_011697 [Tulasnella sp. 408]